jgi:uncharacterized protein involved in response to NO
MIAAAAFNFIRLCRWAGDRTVADRLVLVLHVGYAFVPIGPAMSAPAPSRRFAARADTAAIEK